MKTNLIGISGKIGSGKDTVGKILNFLRNLDNFNEETPSCYKTKTEWIKDEWDCYKG